MTTTTVKSDTDDEDFSSVYLRGHEPAAGPAPRGQPARGAARVARAARSQRGRTRRQRQQRVTRRLHRRRQAICVRFRY